jgi:stage II sporulation protein D
MRRALPLLVPLLAFLGQACARAPRPVSPPVPPASAPAALPPPAPAAGPAPATAGGEPLIAVGLAWDLDSLTLDPVGRARLEGAAAITLEPSERLTVRVRGDRAEARVLGGAEIRQFALWPRDTLWLAGTDGDPSGPARLVRWNDRSWRGQLKVFVNPRGKLTLASRLTLEAYLLGVLPGEIGPLAEELLEAGRAQAIAARSYTLFYRGRRAAEGFDVYATVEDQVYGAVEDERPLATRCVESTAGEIALFQDAPIRANYSSTCGGIAAEVWEAWPTPPIGYLVSRRDRTGGADHCAASPHHRWREEWTAAEFLSNLRRFGPTHGVRLPPGGPGELQDVRVLSRSRSGRVWSLVVTTTHGEIVIPAHSLRRVLRRGGDPAAILRSNLFKVDVRRDRRTRRAVAVVASGAGSGHGVGLCQTGALGMARNGARGEAILHHYFPGIAIRELY